MGTRSITIFMQDDQEICRLYRQFDGYPEGHGIELAKKCNLQIVNGFSLDMQGGGYANGMGNLAVQVIATLARGINEFHLEPTGGAISDWIEYVYIVRGKVGEKPIIECNTQTGPFPNIQSKAGLVFKGTPDQWLKKSSTA